MSISESLEAIVLNHWEYGEKDRIVSFLTREKGKISAIAKGAQVSRKRFGAPLDLFCWNKIQVRPPKNSSLFFLEEISLRHGFPELRTDYDLLKMAGNLMNFVSLICPDHHPDEQGFDILKSSLHELEKHGPQPEVFWAGLLEIQKVAGWGFSLHSNTFASLPSSLLKEWLDAPIEKKQEKGSLNREDQKILRQLIQNHLTHHSGFSFNCPWMED